MVQGELGVVCAQLLLKGLSPWAWRGYLVVGACVRATGAYPCLHVHFMHRVMMMLYAVRLLCVSLALP